MTTKAQGEPEPMKTISLPEHTGEARNDDKREEGKNNIQYDTMGEKPLLVLLVNHLATPPSLSAHDSV